MRSTTSPTAETGCTTDTCRQLDIIGPSLNSEMINQDMMLKYDSGTKAYRCVGKCDNHEERPPQVCQHPRRPGLGGEVLLYDL